MFCPSCESEYEDGIVHCDDCGVDLLAALPEEPERSVHGILFGEPREDGDAPEDLLEVQVPGDQRTHTMRRIHITRTLADAYIVKDALEAAGFAATVRGEHLVGIAGDVPVVGDSLPSVWVPEAQAERAFRLVTEHAGGSSPEEPDWICPGCNEQIEGQFTDCWQCGTARP